MRVDYGAVIYSELNKKINKLEEENKRKHTALTDASSDYTKLYRKFKEFEAENHKLKLTMQLHAGDCCSLNNEVELFRGHWEDAEDRCDELQKALQEIADCDIRHFHSSACYKMNRIANKVLKG